MLVSTFLTKTTETTMIQAIMYESFAARNHHFTLLGQWYYSKDFVCAFLTCLKCHNTSIKAKNLKIGKILQNSQILSQASLQKIISGMAPSTNILQTYLESAESPLLGTVETSDRCLWPNKAKKPLWVHSKSRSEWKKVE